VAGFNPPGDVLSCSVPRSWTPAGPRQPHLDSRFVSASPDVDWVTGCIQFSNEAGLLRERRPPLRPGTFPVHASTMAFARASYNNSSRVVLLPYIIAGLGTSDRLHLTRRGLAPRKKSQTRACALTIPEPSRAGSAPHDKLDHLDDLRLATGSGSGDGLGGTAVTLTPKPTGFSCTARQPPLPILMGTSHRWSGEHES